MISTSTALCQKIEIPNQNYSKKITNPAMLQETKTSKKNCSPEMHPKPFLNPWFQSARRPPLKFDGGEQFFYIPVPASSSTVKCDHDSICPASLGSDLKKPAPVVLKRGSTLQLLASLVYVMIRELLSGTGDDE
ncbi:hypothetical protein CEXT_393871 [Caerostris extrusa]|uniref:Uncharacterized protein n=1 Tax=Caerostris extrusa TaxID=172846 RepID=A0AAV4RIW7_CAEEX|nr:hypothetical protein CEXT_393871 [Caerostris extrusa]